MKRLEEKQSRESQEKEYKESQELLEEFYRGAKEYDEGVREDPVLYLNMLLDDFIDFKIDMESLVEYFDRCPNTPYILQAKKAVQLILDKYDDYG